MRMEAPTIDNSKQEGVEVASHTLPGEALVVALVILGIVYRSNLPDGLANLDDDIIAALIAHRLCREIGVAPRTVPISIRRQSRTSPLLPYDWRCSFAPGSLRETVLLSHVFMSSSYAC